MRILTLMYHASPWANAIGLSLKAQGHEVHIFDYTVPADGAMQFLTSDTEEYLRQYDGVHLVKPKLQGSLRHFAATREFREIVARVNPDVTICLYAGGFAWLCYLSRTRPYAVYVVGSDVLSGGALKRKLTRAALRGAALVFANGEYLAGETRRLTGRTDVRNLLIGVSLGELHIGPKAGRLRIINHRLFDRTYNNETIIRALALLSDELPDYEVVFASGGPQLERSMNLADQLLTPETRRRVAFWRGQRTRADLLKFLSTSDVCVSMSLSDGTSTSVLEAMACGAYPVLSDIPQNRPLIDPQRPNGRLVAPLDYGALAGILRECILRPEGARTRAAANRAMIGKIADGESNRRQLSDALRSLVMAAGADGCMKA